MDNEEANAAFDGFWTAQVTFSLPADAGGVSLNFSEFQADDRAVMFLNGVDIGSMSGNLGLGFMVFDYEANYVEADYIPYSFPTPAAQSGEATTPFIIGGLNTLQVIVNSVDGAPVVPDPRPLQGFDPLNNGTFFQATVQVTYTPVPEPSTWTLGIGAAALGGLIARSRRKRG